MPSNSTWVCFNCRKAVRQPTMAGAPVDCPHCHEACTFLGHRIPIPRRHNLAAWKKLQCQVEQSGVAAAQLEHKRNVRQQHRLEQRIGRLKREPRSDGRDQFIRQLTEQLSAQKGGSRAGPA